MGGQLVWEEVEVGLRIAAMYSRSYNGHAEDEQWPWPQSLVAAMQLFRLGRWDAWELIFLPVGLTG